MIGLLRGHALAWAKALSCQPGFEELSYDSFIQQFGLVFDHPDHGSNASARLLELRQRSLSMGDYSVQFRTLAKDACWNKEALKAVFIKGLNDRLKDELASRDSPAHFVALVNITIRLDNRLRERRREGGRRISAGESSRRSPPECSLPSCLVEEPMQLDHTQLTPVERWSCRRSGACFYCDDKSHHLAQCPIRPKEPARQ